MKLARENQTGQQVSTVKPQADLLSKFVDGSPRYNFPANLDGLAISKDGNIAAGWRGSYLELRNLRNGSTSSAATQQLISSITFSPSGNQLLVGGRKDLGLYQLS